MSGNFLALLGLPLCGLFAGGMLWRRAASKPLNDSSLLWGFMLPFVIGAVLLALIGQLDFVRMRLEPGYKTMRDLQKDPLIGLLQRTVPDDYAKVEPLLKARAAAGMSLAAIFAEARPWLQAIGTKQVGRADFDSRAAWAQNLVDTLDALNERSPGLCVAFLARQKEGFDALRSGMSQENTQSFRTALMGVLRSAQEGGQQAGAAQATAVSAAGRAAVIDLVRQVAGRYGELPVQIVASRDYARTSPAMGEKVCKARMALLALTLDQPSAVADSLLKELLP